MKSPPITILGAGIAGLTLAIALIQRGMTVQVLEQASQFQPIGAGIQLSANATRVLDALGMGEALARIAFEPPGKVIRLWDSGETWPLFDLGATSRERYGAPYLTVHRGDLHQLLLETLTTLSPDAVVMNACVTRVIETDRCAVVHLANGSIFETQILVGADGVHSVARTTLAGPDIASFTGNIAWRAVVPMERIPKNARRTEGQNWVGPGAHIVLYPLRQGTLLNFAGIVERGGDWQVESWTEAGAVAECEADFDGWNSEIRDIIASFPSPPFKWAMLSRPVLSKWSSAHIVLIGDAAHPMLPFLAQGGVMAIEDAIVLARALALYSDEAPVAFAAFEKVRIERANKVVTQSAAQARRFHNNKLASAAEAAAFVSSEWSEAKVLSRYEWLFAYDALTVPL